MRRINNFRSENDVRYYVRRSGYRYDYLAQRLGCSRGSLYQFCCGRAGLSTQKLAKLAEILRVSMDVLHRAHGRAAKKLAIRHMQTDPEIQKEVNDVR